VSEVFALRPRPALLEKCSKRKSSLVSQRQAWHFVRVSSAISSGLPSVEAGVEHSEISKTRLLVVDDDESVREIVAEILLAEGYAPSTAASVADACALLDKEPQELVITDINMPETDGLAFLRILRERYPETGVIMMTGYGQIESAVEALKLGASDYLTKPIRVSNLAASVLKALQTRNENLENLEYHRNLEGVVARKTLELERAYAQITETYKITLEALVTALDARECETGHHSQRVVRYSLAIAQEMGLKPEQMEHLARGALLHDIGKIGVPDSILLKPGRLTETEWEEMRKHPETGARILSDIEFLKEASEIVLSHQEQWSGAGYPRGLCGEEIHLGARIFAVADTLDAIVSDRPYRKGRSLDHARTEIQKHAGTQFDPKVVEAFMLIDDDTLGKLRRDETIYRTKS
jgi:putative nucleotidyltransferase with HDIG domain